MSTLEFEVYLDEMRSYLNKQVAQHQMAVANLSKGLQVIEKAHVAFKENDTESMWACCTRIKKLTQIGFGEETDP